MTIHANAASLPSPRNGQENAGTFSASALLEAVQDGYFALDAAYCFSYVNGAAGRILGVTPTELLGRCIWQVYPGLEGTDFQHLYRRTMETGAGGEIVSWYADHRRWYQVTTAALAPGLAICFRDITDLKQAEVDTKAEAAALQRLVDAIPYGVFMVDEAFQFHHANAIALQAFGNPEGGLSGVDLREALRAAWRPDAAQQLISMFEQTMQSRKACATRWPNTIRSDRVGCVEAYDFKMEPTMLPGGIPGLAVYFHDLSEHEARLQELRAREQHHQFLMRLSDCIGCLTSTPAILGEAARQLADHLRADRVGYALDRGDGETVEVLEHYAVGLEGITGVHRYADFEAELIEPLRTGRPVVRSNTLEMPSLSAAQRAAHQALQIGATINIPLLRDGALRAILFVHSRAPREWRQDEIALTTDVAARTWDVVERAGAESQLRSIAETLRLFIEHAPAAIVMFDRDMNYLAASRRFVEDMKLPHRDLRGMNHYEIFPEIPAHWREVNARCLAGAVESSDAEPFVRRDGSVDWLRWEMRPWYAAGGHIGGALLFCEVITAAREAQLALAYSERRFRAAQASSLDGFMMLEAVREKGAIVDFVWTHANAAAERIAQVPDGGLVGRRLLEVHPGNRDAGLFDRYVAVIESGQPFVDELHYAHDGLDLALRISVVQVDDGIACTIADRREHRALQAQLEQSEHRRTRALQAASVGTWEHDVRSGSFTSDVTLLRLFGLTLEERLRLEEQWETFMSPVVALQIHAAREAAIAAGTPLQVEYPIRRADGAQRWLRAHGDLERDDKGRVLRLVGVTQDITESRAARVALEASSARLEEATRAAELGIHEYYPQSGELIWDARIRDWWGLSAHEQVSYEKFLRCIVEEDRAATQEAVERALDPLGMGQYDAEYRVRHPDGTVRWMHATGSVRFEGGQAVRLIGTLQDITRDKQLTDELRLADRQKDVFIATLAHELRNPLAPISTAAELLTSPELTARQLARVQDIIKRQLKHLSWLLDDLLDISRITQGKLVLRSERIGLASVVSGAVETANPIVERKQHALSVQLPDRVTWLRGDPLRLSQIISNLLTNAAKYTDPRGHIDLVARVSGEWLEIEVKDNGVGIAAAMMPHLFDMFSQADAADARSEGGLGIGLALVKGLAALHGGSVTADSAGPGRGSRFSVRLPVVATEAEPPLISSEETDVLVPKRRKVLVVDDNSDAAESMQMLLELAGHVVRTANNGLAALADVECFRPDVALLDIGLPDMDGYELAASLRARLDGHPLTLVALTGWGQSDDLRRASEAGFDHHLTKPADPAQLEALLRTGRLTC